MSVSPGNSQIREGDLPLRIILFFNLLILVALTLFFRHNVSWRCVSPIGIGLSLGLVALELIHLTWRYLGKTLLNLVIPIGSLNIPIGQLGGLIERLHPRMLRDRVLWAQALIFLLIAMVLGYPASSPFHNQDQLPMFENFLVRTDNNVEGYVSGSVLRIAKNIGVVYFEVKILDQSDVSCDWSADTGTVLQPKGCETQYAPPNEESLDLVTVNVYSPCKGSKRIEHLTIEIVGIGP